MIDIIVYFVGVWDIIFSLWYKPSRNLNLKWRWHPPLPPRFTAWGWGVGGHYQSHKKYKTEGKGSRRRKIVKKYGIQPNFLLTRDASAWYDKVSDQWHVSVPKWGESESGLRSVRKVKLAFIWCISSTNNVKSCKNSMKQLKRPTSLISHWFPVEMVHIGPKLHMHFKVAWDQLF